MSSSESEDVSESSSDDAPRSSSSMDMELTAEGSGVIPSSADWLFSADPVTDTSRSFNTGVFSSVRESSIQRGQHVIRSSKPTSFTGTQFVLGNPNDDSTPSQVYSNNTPGSFQAPEDELNLPCPPDEEHFSDIGRWKSRMSDADSLTDAHSPVGRLLFFRSTVGGML